MEIKGLVNKVFCGDTLTTLKSFPDNFIDLVITSPPYFGLRNYGVKGQIGLEDTVEEYLENLLKIFLEIKRVLKPTGQFWLNIGDVYGGSLLGYGASSPSLTGIQSPAGIDNRYPACKPAVSKYKPKCLMLIPERLAIKMVDEQGWYLRNKVRWVKQVLIKKDKRTIGSTLPSSAKDRFIESVEEFYFFTKNKKYYSNLDAVRIPYQYKDNRPPGVLRSRLYPNSKYYEPENFRPLDKKKESVNTRQYVGGGNGAKGGTYNVPHTYNPLGRNIPTAWVVNFEPHNFKKEFGISEHFAVFPTSLVEIPILFGSPEDGIVLDPFCGSGTTLVVAKKLGRKYIGIDINPEYCKLSELRLEKVEDNDRLFKTEGN